MPIFTSDGVLIVRVTNVDVAGFSRSLTAAVGGVMAFGPRLIWITLTRANKEEDYIHLLMTGTRVEAMLFSRSRNREPLIAASCGQSAALQAIPKKAA